MNTPWGTSDGQHKLFDGVYDVSTPSHGGLTIEESVAQQHLSTEAIALADRFGSMLCYEEDCLYAVPCFEWKELRESVNKLMVKPVAKLDWQNTVRVWYPEYFEKRFGIVVGECPYCGVRNRVWCDCEHKAEQGALE